MMKLFWQGKKVFLTGHTGFKGSWLSLWLQLLGVELVGFALRPPTAMNHFTLANIAEGMVDVDGDIRNFALLQQSLKTHQPEIIIHMAAQPLVRYGYREPIETYTTNVMGTVHLLEAARHCGSVKTIINVTTDKCYENKKSHSGYRENDRLGGCDPYSNSKACSELVTEAYRYSYLQQCSIGVATVRAGNVIGGGDWAEDRLLPDIIQACIQQQPLMIRHPNAIRPWQHVLEPLNGYLQLAQRLYESPVNYAESWNFGPSEEDLKSVSWICDYLIRYWGSKTQWIQDNEQHPHEEMLLKLDCAKTKARLGWMPRWSLEKCLQETASWYEACQMKKNMREVSLAQIQDFMRCEI